MVVSPQHCVLVGAEGQLENLFDEATLVPAKSLTLLPGIRSMKGKKKIEWWHFTCDQHDVVLANGAQAETLTLGDMVLNKLGEEDLVELFKVFGRKESAGPLNGPSARPKLKAGKAQRFIKSILKAQDCFA